jgi:flagellar hook-basal body complex protein FliE
MLDIKIGSVPSLGAKEQKIQTMDGQATFTKMLKDQIQDLNRSQKDSELAMTDIATGQVKDLHQAALKIDKAEIQMKFMLEVRNKALSAYKEISRIQM